MTQRFVDLTYPVHEGMTAFPVEWHPRVEVTILGTHEVHGRETRRLVIGTHSGTHVDAPRHFVPGGATVDDIELEVLVGPARVLDLSDRADAHEITVADLSALLGEARPERLVLRFDWSDRWGSTDFYRGHSYLSEAAAEWLVERGLRLLGMDTPMPDNPAHGRGTERDSPVHKILLGNGVVLVEYLCNLRSLTEQDVELIVLPLKVLDGDGAPARCVAVETKSG
jgi:arylformamidase